MLRPRMIDIIRADQKKNNKRKNRRNESKMMHVNFIKFVCLFSIYLFFDLFLFFKFRNSITYVILTVNIQKNNNKRDFDK